MSFYAEISNLGAIVAKSFHDEDFRLLRQACVELLSAWYEPGTNEKKLRDHARAIAFQKNVVIKIAKGKTVKP